MTQIRPLQRPGELRDLAQLFAQVFGPPASSPHDLRGSLLAGGSALGAFRGGVLCAGLWAFAGADERGPLQHSHMLGVRAELRGQGLGEALKRAHAAACLERGIERIRWTFDPLMSANARFNLERLGALGEEWIEDCYGALEGPLDPVARTGAPAPSDRLHVCWYLRERPRLIESAQPVRLPRCGPERTATEALAELRAGLQPRLAHGERVVGCVEHEGGWAYRLGRLAEAAP